MSWRDDDEYYDNDDDYYDDDDYEDEDDDEELGSSSGGRSKNPFSSSGSSKLPGRDRAGGGSSSGSRFGSGSVYGSGDKSRQAPSSPFGGSGARLSGGGSGGSGGSRFGSGSSSKSGGSGGSGGSRFGSGSSSKSGSSGGSRFGSGSSSKSGGSGGSRFGSSSSKSSGGSKGVDDLRNQLMGSSKRDDDKKKDSRSFRSGDDSDKSKRGGGFGSRFGRGDKKDKKDDKKATGTSRSVSSRSSKSGDDSGKSRLGGISSRFSRGDKKDDKKSTGTSRSVSAQSSSSSSRFGGGALGGLRRGGGDKKESRSSFSDSGDDGGKSRLGGLTSRLGRGKKDDDKSTSGGGTQSRSAFGGGSSGGSSSRFGSSSSKSSRGDKDSSGQGRQSALGSARGGRSSAAASESSGGVLGRVTGAFRRGGGEERRPEKQSKPRRSKAPKVQNDGLSLDNKLDIIGVGLVFGSLVIFFSALSSEQAAISGLNRAIGQLLGWGALAFPVAMFAVGMWLIVRHFGENAPTVDPVRVAGIVLGYISLLILFQYMDSFSYQGIANAQLLEARLDMSWRLLHDGGGLVGSVLYFQLVSNVTEIGGFFVLLFTTVVSAMLITRQSASEIAVIGISLWRSFRSRLQNRAAKRRAEKLAAQRAQPAAAPQISVSRPQPEALPGTTAAALPSGGATPIEQRDILFRRGGQALGSNGDNEEENLITQPIPVQETSGRGLFGRFRRGSKPAPAVPEPLVAQKVDDSAGRTSPGKAVAAVAGGAAGGLMGRFRRGNKQESPAPQPAIAASLDEGNGGSPNQALAATPTTTVGGLMGRLQRETSSDPLNDKPIGSPPKPAFGKPPTQSKSLFDIKPAPAVASTPVLDDDDDMDDEIEKMERIGILPGQKPKSSIPSFKSTSPPKPPTRTAASPLFSASSAPAAPDTTNGKAKEEEEPAKPLAPAASIASSPAVDSPEVSTAAPEDPFAARLERLNELRSGQTDKTEPVKPATPAPTAPVVPTTPEPVKAEEPPVQPPAASVETESSYSPLGRPEDILSHDEEMSATVKPAAPVSTASAAAELDESPKPAAPAINPGKQAPMPLPVSTGPTNQSKKRQNWQLPEYRTLLSMGSEQEFDREQLLTKAQTIEDTLDSFGAPGRVVEVNTGPVITQFGVEPDYITARSGKKSRVKVSTIAQLDKDLQLALGAKSIRIEAPVPGKGFVGIEVPNAEPSLVSLRDVMESPEFQRIKSPLAIGLGQSVDGSPISADLTDMPHLLIAGTTGSGKSVLVNAIIASILVRNRPDIVKLIMIDPKRVELTGYNGIPHLIAPVVVELERIVGVLKWVTREMDERYKRFSNAGARNIVDYNEHLDPDEEPMPYIVVVIDELADLMMLAPEETERVITRIAALARATGIHLVIATQRPSVDVVTGLIKANFPARIAFAVAGGVDSRVILDQPGAERLLGRGDMLYLSGDTPAPLRLQGVFVSDMESNNIVRYWKMEALKQPEAAQPQPIRALSSSGTAPAEPTHSVLPRGERVKQQAFWDSNSTAESNATVTATGRPAQGNGADALEDELYETAVEMVRRHNRASVSMLQRKLRIGYTRAARLIDTMEEQGVVGPAKDGSSKPRDVLPIR